MKAYQQKKSQNYRKHVRREEKLYILTSFFICHLHKKKYSATDIKYRVRRIFFSFFYFCFLFILLFSWSRLFLALYSNCEANTSTGLLFNSYTHRSLCSSLLTVFFVFNFICWNISGCKVIIITRIRMMDKTAFSTNMHVLFAIFVSPCTAHIIPLQRRMNKNGVANENASNEYWSSSDCEFNDKIAALRCLAFIVFCSCSLALRPLDN